MFKKRRLVEVRGRYGSHLIDRHTLRSIAERILGDRSPALVDDGSADRSVT